MGEFAFRPAYFVLFTRLVKVFLPAPDGLYASVESSFTRTVGGEKAVTAQERITQTQMAAAEGHVRILCWYHQERSFYSK